ncbi:MAG: thermonuclease family protein [Pseudomonadota bacterium]
MIIVFLLCPSFACANKWEGKVVGVADGDTITVLSDHKPIKVRLFGIDCPEKHQAFGNNAKEFASKFVFGKVVTVEEVAKDKYGRTVGKVFLGKKSLNAELLMAGLAWHYKRYDKSKFFADLEWVARKEKKGLWADFNPKPPWQWRIEKKGKGPSPVHGKNSARYSGNVKSKVFHAARCSHFECNNCSVFFNKIEEAIKAGYRPHTTCVRGEK